MSFRVRLCLLVAILLSSPSLGQPACPATEESGPVAKFLHQHFGSGSYDLDKVVQKFFITDPQKQILPGDILVYPFKNHTPDDTGNAASDRPANDFAQSEEPDSYKAALEGFGHAGIAARNPEGNLFHLDAPLPPPFLRGEFQGKDKYYVIRPKLPKGLTRETFEKKVNDAVAVFKNLGYEYDALMEMNYLNQNDLKKMDALVEKGAPAPDGRPDTAHSPIPPQFCSELTQTILVLAGAQPARTVGASKMFQLALEHVQAHLKDKKLDGKEATQAIQKAVDEIITMFAGPIDRFEKEIQRDLARAEKDLDEMPKDDPVRKEVEAARQDMRQALERIKHEKQRWEQAKTLLRQVALMRAQFPGLDPLGVMKRPIVRPIDILREAESGDGNFELVGYYPGHLPATCQPPAYGGGPPPNLPDLPPDLPPSDAHGVTSPPPRP